MKTTTNPTLEKVSSSGIGDPYWFEWSVGLKYILELLNPESGVSSVTLQDPNGEGLDDVVVKFENEQSRFIQVKHTRVSDTLTYGDLVSPATGGSSLLQHIAEAWKSVGKPPEAWVSTNRPIGSQETQAGDPKVLRPALEKFLEWMTNAVDDIQAVDEIEVPIDWADSWNSEWLKQLENLDDPEKLEFLRAFNIDCRTSAIMGRISGLN